MGNKPLIILMSYVIILIVSSCSMEYSVSKMEKPKESVVSFKGTSWSGRTNFNWEFYDENKRRYIIDIGNDEIGIKYVIIYDSINPSNKYYVDRGRQVIYPDEGIITLPCEITKEKIIYPNQLKFVVFEYYFGNEYMDMGSHMRAGKNDTIILKKGDRFLVEVCKLNHVRTILHFDKPISDRRPLKEYTRIFTDSIKHHHNHSTH